MVVDAIGDCLSVDLNEMSEILGGGAGVKEGGVEGDCGGLSGH